MYFILLPFPSRCPSPHLSLPSFPTRRSSDLSSPSASSAFSSPIPVKESIRLRFAFLYDDLNTKGISSSDRKSTRLNSSHVAISYAVFCLKKKKYNTKMQQLKMQLSKDNETYS